MTTFSSFEVISLGLTVLGRMHGGTQNQEKTWNWLRMLDNLMILMMLKCVIIVIFSMLDVINLNCLIETRSLGHIAYLNSISLLSSI